MQSVTSKVLAGFAFAALCAMNAGVLSAAQPGMPKLAKELAPARGNQKIIVTNISTAQLARHC